MAQGSPAQRAARRELRVADTNQPVGGCSNGSTCVAGSASNGSTEADYSVVAGPDRRNGGQAAGTLYPGTLGLKDYRITT